MKYKQTNAAETAKTQNLSELIIDTDSIYETINIIAKRANQISVEIKDELNNKLEQFASYSDNLEEIFENREQIEISKYYEGLPKPALIAIKEFEEDKIYYRNPHKEKELEKENKPQKK